MRRFGDRYLRCRLSRKREGGNKRVTILAINNRRKADPASRLHLPVNKHARVKLSGVITLRHGLKANIVNCLNARPVEKPDIRGLDGQVFQDMVPA